MHISARRAVNLRRLPSILRNCCADAIDELLVQMAVGNEPLAVLKTTESTARRWANNAVGITQSKSKRVELTLQANHIGTRKPHAIIRQRSNQTPGTRNAISQSTDRQGVMF